TSKSTSSSSLKNVENKPSPKDMNQLGDGTNYSFSSLLELAANNNFEEFKQLMGCDASVVDDVGLWYVRKNSSKQIVLEQRTPLMVAATYGCVDVLKLILSQPVVNVNLSCGLDKSTVLHCAVSSGSVNAIDVVKLLLLAGADQNSMNAHGLCPIDMIAVPPNLPGMRVSLEELLTNNVSDGAIGEHNLQVSITRSNSNSPTFSLGNGSPCSLVDSVSSRMITKLNDLPANSVLQKKEYPMDPSLPDIKNNIYSTDEFRMFSLRSGLVQGLIPMIGPSVLLFTQERMLAEETRGNTITVVCLALIFERVLAGEGICVHMPMGCSNVGFIQLSIELGSARTE
ncbi:hypothetical protein U1Q18_015453, partial [Sarracenia purpurea var. burkii]